MITPMNELIKALKRIASRHPELKLMYLFGSYAKGKEMPTSDIDIAVITSDMRIIPELTAEIAKELNIPEERISIVDLRNADTLLKIDILRDGIEIKREIDVNDIIPSSSEITEVAELEKSSSSKSWLRGDPIDILVIRDIVTRIIEDKEDLQELIEMGYDKVMKDKWLRKAFERTLQTLIEGMMDLLRHIVAGLNLGIATYYRDYVEFCKKNNVISEETANTILRLIPIRHILVRKYRTANHEETWRSAIAATNIADKLVKEVRTYLKRKIGHDIT